jgi:histone H3/H4
MTTPRFIPAAEGALQAGMSREQLIRRVQRREVRGALQDGRWFVDARDVARLAAERGRRITVGAA